MEDEEIIALYWDREQAAISASESKYGALCLSVSILLIYAVRTDDAGNVQEAEIVISGQETGVLTTEVFEVPSDGELYVAQDVLETVDLYRGQERLYFLSISLFRDGVSLTADDDAVTAELGRLAEEGYTVGFAESWAYEGDGEQRAYIYVYGLFTEAQIDEFSPDPGYGYILQFATYGDGTPVAVESIIDEYE